jgi:hypothetical protein
MLFPFAKPRAQVRPFREGGAGEAQTARAAYARVSSFYTAALLFLFPTSDAASFFVHK